MSCSNFSTTKMHLTHDETQKRKPIKCTIHKVHDVLQIHLNTRKMSEIWLKYSFGSNIAVFVILGHQSLYWYKNMS